MRCAEPDCTCRELTQVLTDYLEGAMAPRDRAQLESHLEECEGCANYLSQMRETVHAVRGLRAREAVPTVPADLLAAFRAWKQDEPLPGPES